MLNIYQYARESFRIEMAPVLVLGARFKSFVINLNRVRIVRYTPSLVINENKKTYIV